MLEIGKNYGYQGAKSRQTTRNEINRAKSSGTDLNQTQVNLCSSFESSKPQGTTSGNLLRDPKALQMTI